MTKRTSTSWLAAVSVLVLLVTACGPADPALEVEVAAQAEPTTTTTTTVTSEPESDVADTLTLEEHLVAVINADADTGACGAEAEAAVNALFEDNDEPSEEEQIEYARQYASGQQECIQQATDAIAALTAPPEAAAAHEAFVAGRLAYLTAWRAAIDEAQTFDEISQAFFGPGPGSAEWVAMSDSCRVLENLARSAGIDADLMCPDAAPADPVEVAVVVDESGWSVDPSSVVQDEGAGAAIFIDNQTDEDQHVVVVDIFTGRPDALPVVNGVLDTSRCNQVFGDEDPDTSPANFGCPGLEGEGIALEAEQIFPGDTRLIDIVGPGIHVVLDYQAGGYEAGNYVVVEVEEAA